MCTTCEDFAAGLIDSVTADVCRDAERGAAGLAGEFVEDDEDLAPPDEDDGEDVGFDDIAADHYYGE